MNTQRGFTLMELMIAMAIDAALAARKEWSSWSFDDRTSPSQIDMPQHLTRGARHWRASCYFGGMRSDRGFTLLELLVVLGLIGILSAIAIPTLSTSTERNAVWTASEQLGSQMRQARLKAITRNTPFRIVFDCPAANQYRLLIVDGTIDDADRCDQTLEHDSGIYTMPPSVTFDNAGDAVPALQVNGRGVYSLPGGVGALPLTITVKYRNTHSRQLTISATGQIAFEIF